MGINRRTLIQTILAIPVVVLSDRANAVVHKAIAVPMSHPAPTIFEANLRWAMDAELTPCRHYGAQDAIPAFKAKRHTHPCILHVGI